MCVELIGCDQGDGFKDIKGRAGANIVRDEAVDSQHGTGLEGNSHLCTKDNYPK
jgi:hypothetical protein